MQLCLPERIVLCIDACEDKQSRFPPQHGGKLSSPFSLIKRCAESFLMNKAAMNSDHQFALLVFKCGAPRMISAFSNKVSELVKQVNSIVPTMTSDQPIQLNSIFQAVYELLLHENASDNVIPVRIFILYGRSGTCVMDSGVLSMLENVIVDLLYIHRPVMSTKEKKRITSNFSQLLSCCSEKSFCAAALSDNGLALQYTMQFLANPMLR